MPYFKTFCKLVRISIYIISVIREFINNFIYMLMATKIVRLYSCRDEELPTICDLAAFSFTRDLADFTTYSPKFKNGYLDSFITSSANAKDVIEPKSETLERTASTARLYSALDSLIDPIKRIIGYLHLAHEKLNISANEFGLSQLRDSITARDPEGAVKNLHVVNSNIRKYKDALMEQGLTETLMELCISASAIIGKEKNTQYAILTNRKGIVQNNLTLFNDLYKHLLEILATGKILYRAKDPVKLQEYTFNQLKKQVRLISKPVSKKNTGVNKKDDAAK